MSQPLSGQRSHSDLVVELYDRHAAGLFAYCFDQLGDRSNAADAVLAVLTSVPVMRPSRALLYALARREISRRDVVYFPPLVDFAVDPATALIERVVRDLRPHQREVLLLSAVCRLAPDELAQVLDVAIDTASQLIMSARNRFAQSLKLALYHARHAEYVPERIAEIYGALEVAPIEDVLARLPWQRPPGDLRARLLALLPQLDPADATRPKTRIPVKQLWPTAPSWPLPLADPDQTTTTSLIPVVPPERESGGPQAGADDPGRSRRGRSRHEATTEPIPRLQGAILAAMEAMTRRPRSRRPQDPQAPASPEAGAANAAAAAAPPEAPPAVPAPGAEPAPLAAPVVDDLLDRAPAAAATAPVIDPAPVDPAPAAAAPDADPDAATGPIPTVGTAVPADTGSAVGGDAVAGTAAADTPGEADPAAEDAGGADPAGTRRRTARPRVSHRKPRRRRREYRFDWAWEVAGLLVAIGVALAVFFSIPMMVP
ncbi:MAG: sigma-70 family RNA polymerase sigma factor [Actinomycetes bacterium]